MPLGPETGSQTRAVWEGAEMGSRKVLGDWTRKVYWGCGGGFLRPSSCPAGVSSPDAVWPKLPSLTLRWPDLSTHAFKIKDFPFLERPYSTKVFSWQMRARCTDSGMVHCNVRLSLFVLLRAGNRYLQLLPTTSNNAPGNARFIVNPHPSGFFGTYTQDVHFFFYASTGNWLSLHSFIRNFHCYFKSEVRISLLHLRY